MVDAINHALHEEMEYNDKMLVYGQDIADPKGGVFTATKGLSKKFGKKFLLHRLNSTNCSYHLCYQKLVDIFPHALNIQLRLFKNLVF